MSSAPMSDIPQEDSEELQALDRTFRDTEQEVQQIHGQLAVVDKKVAHSGLLTLRMAGEVVGLLSRIGGKGRSKTDLQPKEPAAGSRQVVILNSSAADHSGGSEEEFQALARELEDTQAKLTGLSQAYKEKEALWGRLLKKKDEQLCITMAREQEKTRQAQQRVRELRAVADFHSQTAEAHATRADHFEACVEKYVLALGHRLEGPAFQLPAAAQVPRRPTVMRMESAIRARQGGPAGKPGRERAQSPGEIAQHEAADLTKQLIARSGQSIDVHLHRHESTSLPQQFSDCAVLMVTALADLAGTDAELHALSAAREALQAAVDVPLPEVPGAKRRPGRSRDIATQTETGWLSGGSLTAGRSWRMSRLGEPPPALVGSPQPPQHPASRRSSRPSTRGGQGAHKAPARPQSTDSPVTGWAVDGDEQGPAAAAAPAAAGAAGGGAPRGRGGAAGSAGVGAGGGAGAGAGAAPGAAAGAGSSGGPSGGAAGAAGAGNSNILSPTRSAAAAGAVSPSSSGRSPTASSPRPPSDAERRAADTEESILAQGQQASGGAEGRGTHQQLRGGLFGQGGDLILFRGEHWQPKGTKQFDFARISRDPACRNISVPLHGPAEWSVVRHIIRDGDDVIGNCVRDTVGRGLQSRTRPVPILPPSEEPPYPRPGVQRGERHWPGGGAGGPQAFTVHPAAPPHSPAERQRRFNNNRYLLRSAG